MMECGECEGSVYQGHAPDCSRRCQNMHSDGAQLLQCERRADHPGPHGVYGPEPDDDIDYSWLSSVADTTRCAEIASDGIRDYACQLAAEHPGDHEARYGNGKPFPWPKTLGLNRSSEGASDE